MKILFEDSYILVCEKPAGIPVQSQKIGTKDMVSILKNHLKDTEKKPGEPYLGLVHRLDQPVQGVLVFAKTKEAAAVLSAQVSGGRMEKEYLAVICGQPTEKEGRLVDYLQKDTRTNTSKIVKAGTKGAKRAELTYRILKEKDQRALAAIRLCTGRHHQIRVQMAGAGMPLAGDKKYNSLCEEDYVPVALCACRLTFIHPKSGNKVTFESNPQGKIFEKILEEG